MQDTSTIRWEPMYEGQLPWFIRLFVVYLAVVLLLFCFRAIRMLRHLRSFSKAGQEANAWGLCHARALALKNWSALTFLLSFLVSSWSMTETLHGISMQKVTGTAFLAGATAEVLTTFCVVRSSVSSFTPLHSSMRACLCGTSCDSRCRRPGNLFRVVRAVRKIIFQRVTGSALLLFPVANALDKS